MGTGGFWGAPHPDSHRLPALSRLDNAEIGPGRALTARGHSSDATHSVFLEAGYLPQAAEAIRHATSHTIEALAVGTGGDHPLAVINENINTGSLARCLRSDGLLMEEQTL